MRVAVACDGPDVSPHFGRCEQYLIAEITGAEVTLGKRLQNLGHAPGAVPALMVQEGVDCVLAGGAGPRAVDLLAEAGVRLIVGVSGDAMAALRALAAGELAEGTTLCDH